MTDTLVDTSAAPAELPDGPHDLEFFLDPLCPFAWQTSVWIRRVAELKGLNVGWRFISLYVIHENDEENNYVSKETLHRGLEFHRVLAEVRNKYGNGPVGKLYEGWGRQLWYAEPGTSSAEIAKNISIPDLLEAEGLPMELVEEAGNESHDALIRAETALGFERAGTDVGTPIITYGVGGLSFFGPVISSIPSDEVSVAMYDALRVLVAHPDFAEVKRTNRPPLDLPLLQGRV
jgi:hypothetical protein